MAIRTFTLRDILSDSNYSLDIFKPEEIAALTLHEKNDKPYLYDFVSGKERLATPEEIVRQLFLYQLINTYHYPKDRIAVEKGVWFGSSVAEKRADIIVSNKNDPDTAYIIVELKKPNRKDGLEQLKSYCNAEGAPIAVWTNGAEMMILHREDPNTYRNISAIPPNGISLTQIIDRTISIDDLKRSNKLVTQNWTLKKVILDLENLVLANAGVDAFEEVFKLIYSKLYDEYQAKRRSRKEVLFRVAGESHQELYDKINNLFQEAKRLWGGIFLPSERIDLSPSHLAVCVSFLQEVALFNSNLQIIDEAFEYLVTQVAKGSKGQYFTPRHVIDMCVKMLNPKNGEYMIDTAAGSCGFTVHTIFHVWGGEFTADGPTRDQAEYANHYVYGLDFDPRSIKISKALNLIAGDGRTNVYRVNTLDPRSWDDDARTGLTPRLREFDNYEDNQHNRKSFRDFDFDIVMTNPPFAGDVSDSRILHQYELAKQWKGVDSQAIADDPFLREEYLKDPFRFSFKESGKWAINQSRDILFIERNLQFLKPGGRMAIVLPQGRFNNISDSYVRWFITQKARILAVVGLHGNTFKPHTGTKTSVLFLQKWNNDPYAGQLCPYLEDYPIFFATSQESGKDNSGEYIYLKDSDNQDLQDIAEHKIVKQDLYDISLILTNQFIKAVEHEPSRHEELSQRLKYLLEQIPSQPTITEAFIEFAKAENLSFWQED